MADGFVKFTEEARRALALAQEEAQRLNHHSIGTEHLLLGLVRESDDVAAAVLAGSGLDLNRVRSAIEQIIGSGDQAVVGQIGLTSRTRKVIELAADEARLLNHAYIGTEHLLLGVLREGEGIAAGVLLSFGLTLDHLREQTRVVLLAQTHTGEQRTGSQSSPLQVRGRVTTPSAQVHLTPMPGTGGLVGEPALEDLVRVIPVAQTQRCNGVAVTILSVELYTDGFLVNARVLSQSSAASPPSPPWRFLRPAFEAEDDRGNQFTGRPYFGSLGAGRKMRYLYCFTPQFDRSAHELWLRCTDLRWREPGCSGDQEVALGPCTFSIPLGDRPVSEETRPDQ